MSSRSRAIPCDSLEGGALTFPRTELHLIISTLRFSCVYEEYGQGTQYR